MVGVAPSDGKSPDPFGSGLCRVRRCSPGYWLVSAHGFDAEPAHEPGGDVFDDELDEAVAAVGVVSEAHNVAE
jgi:hypothetical protein